MKNSIKATFIGFGAIILWAFLALLVSFTSPIPPFQLVAMSFTIGSFAGFIIMVLQRKNPVKLMKMPPQIWIIGIVGLFGYHFFFFLALRNAPLFQANLINYLWPLLIVIFSCFLPKKYFSEKLNYWHILGILISFFGVLLIIGSNEGLSNNSYSYIWFGYFAAVIAAFIWAAYSVLLRLYAFVSSQSVTYFLAASAIIALLAHLVFENSFWPQDFSQWLAIILLGLGPVGGAFYFWDYGMKHGDIRVLGALAYITPLLSAIILTIWGVSEPHWQLWLAVLAIILGAIISAKERIFVKQI